MQKLEDKITFAERTRRIAPSATQAVWLTSLEGKMLHKLCTLVFLFTAHYGTASCYATILVQMSVEELAQKSHAIVHGFAEKSWSAWDDERGKIYTYTVIRVVNPLKAPLAERIVVKELGGTVGDMSMVVSGAPRFYSGEEVVLFLARDREGDFRTLGFTQGKFEVQIEGGQKVVVHGTEGAAVVTPEGRQVNTESRPRSLTQFLSHVRRLTSRTAR